jgi:hypothetical protein
MWLLLFCMMITASTELGPNRWVPAVLEAGGIAGILVLAYINGIMAALRYKAEPFIERLSPTGVLLASSVLSAAGLLWLSFAETTLMAFASATLFAVGVCFFWPTMLGVVSERVPRSGALGLGLMGAVGMATVGLITSPQMGSVADTHAHEYLATEQSQSTLQVMNDVAAVYPEAANQADGVFTEEMERVAASVSDVLAAHERTGELPEPETANALRSIIDSGPAVASTGHAEAQALPDRAGEVLLPADNYGGRVSFRYIVPFTCLLILIFGIMYVRDRQRGGYAAIDIHDT